MAPEWKPPTDDELLAQLSLAREAGRMAALGEPRAASARYDAPSGRIVLELTNGCLFAFPPEREPELRGLSPQVLAGVRVRPGGRGLYWEGAGAEVSVPGLMGGEHDGGARRWVPRVAEPRRPYPDPGGDA